MKRILLLIVPLLVFIFFSSSDLSAQGKSDEFKLPDTAKKLSPSLYSLGKSEDINGREVQGFAFIHRKDKEVRGGNKPDKAGGPSCYGFLANGAKWKSEEPWVMNTSNTDEMNGGTLFSVQESNISLWEAAAGNSSIIGGGSTTGSILVADTSSPDDANEVYFAPIADSNTIAVTIVWGYFSGPPQIRELIEWDQVYNTNYPWSLGAEAGKMNFDNISTHELGHTFGMDDIYDTGCSDVTMFGYAGFGETNKTSLEPADVVGISNLYN